MDRTVRKRTEITVETHSRTTIRWRNITLYPLVPGTAANSEPVEIVGAVDLQDDAIPGPSRSRTKGEQQ